MYDTNGAKRRRTSFSGMDSDPASMDLERVKLPPRLSISPIKVKSKGFAPIHLDFQESQEVPMELTQTGLTKPSKIPRLSSFPLPHYSTMKLTTPMIRHVNQPQDQASSQNQPYLESMEITSRNIVDDGVPMELTVSTKQSQNKSPTRQKSGIPRDITRLDSNIGRSISKMVPSFDKENEMISPQIPYSAEVPMEETVFGITRISSPPSANYGHEPIEKSPGSKFQMQMDVTEVSKITHSPKTFSPRNNNVAMPLPTSENVVTEVPMEETQFGIGRLQVPAPKRHTSSPVSDRQSLVAHMEETETPQHASAPNRPPLRNVTAEITSVEKTETVPMEETLIQKHYPTLGSVNNVIQGESNISMDETQIPRVGPVKANRVSILMPSATEQQFFSGTPPVITHDSEVPMDETNTFKRQSLAPVEEAIMDETLLPMLQRNESDHDTQPSPESRLSSGEYENTNSRNKDGSVLAPLTSDTLVVPNIFSKPISSPSSPKITDANVSIELKEHLSTNIMATTEKESSMEPENLVFQTTTWDSKDIVPSASSKQEHNEAVPPSESPPQDHIKNTNNHIKTGVGLIASGSDTDVSFRGQLVSSHDQNVDTNVHFDGNMTNEDGNKQENQISHGHLSADQPIPSEYGTRSSLIEVQGSESFVVKNVDIDQGGLQDESRVTLDGPGMATSGEKHNELETENGLPSPLAEGSSDIPDTTVADLPDENKQENGPPPGSVIPDSPVYEQQVAAPSSSPGRDADMTMELSSDPPTGTEESDVANIDTAPPIRGFSGPLSAQEFADHVRNRGAEHMDTLYEVTEASESDISTRRTTVGSILQETDRIPEVPTSDITQEWPKRGSISQAVIDAAIDKLEAILSSDGLAKVYQSMRFQGETTTEGKARRVISWALRLSVTPGCQEILDSGRESCVLKLENKIKDEVHQIIQFYQGEGNRNEELGLFRHALSSLASARVNVDISKWEEAGVARLGDYVDITAAKDAIEDQLRNIYREKEKYHKSLTEMVDNARHEMQNQKKERSLLPSVVEEPESDDNQSSVLEVEGFIPMGPPIQSHRSPVSSPHIAGNQASSTPKKSPANFSPVQASSTSKKTPIRHIPVVVDPKPTQVPKNVPSEAVKPTNVFEIDAVGFNTTRTRDNVIDGVIDHQLNISVRENGEITIRKVSFNWRYPLLATAVPHIVKQLQGDADSCVHQLVQAWRLLCQFDRDLAIVDVKCRVDSLEVSPHGLNANLIHMNRAGHIDITLAMTWSQLTLYEPQITAKFVRGKFSGWQQWKPNGLFDCNGEIVSRALTTLR